MEFTNKLVEEVLLKQKIVIFMARYPEAGGIEIAASLAEMLKNIYIIDVNIFRQLRKLLAYDYE